MNLQEKPSSRSNDPEEEMTSGNKSDPAIKAAIITGVVTVVTTIITAVVAPFVTRTPPSPPTPSPPSPTSSHSSSPVKNIQRYVSPDFDGRIGQLEFANTGLYPVRVRLWHSDDGSLWRTYTFQGGERFLLDDGNQPVSFGSSWGIQVGESEIKPIARVAEWKVGSDGRHYFEVTTDNFWK